MQNAGRKMTVFSTKINLHRLVYCYPTPIPKSIIEHKFLYVNTIWFEFSDLEGDIFLIPNARKSGVSNLHDEYWLLMLL